MSDSFKVKKPLKIGKKNYSIYSLKALEASGFKNLSKIPYSIRILLENLLRNEDGKGVQRGDVEALAAWNPKKKSDKEISFTPARVVLQDFTGVPAVVDLAVMRDAIKEMGGGPKKINPLEPVDLVIDHSVQVDAFGSADAFKFNVQKEVERNRERYQFLKWGQKAFDNFRAVPPGTGIVHQVNLEYLASVVLTKAKGGEDLAYPDTLVGTDSHTTMINGLGVLGWGVGGIEAEAAMLGQPISMLIPEVVGFKLTGELAEGATATDLVLTVTQMLRKKGVVGKFVEFYGSGLATLPLADRATIANMSPEYGATMGFFPVDEKTLEYLKLTGRSKEVIERTETYLKEQGLFRTSKSPDPEYSDHLELDMSTVEPCIAGPKRPQDRILLKESKRSFREALLAMMKAKNGNLDPKRIQNWLSEGGGTDEPDREIMESEKLGGLATAVAVKTDDKEFKVRHGSVVIAAITSCTNTSNPQVMVGAGLLAKKAVEKGLQVKPWVKTSFAPGSQVVTDYVKKAGLVKYLEALRFHLVGYGCTTCIGNSGPLAEPIANAIKEGDLVATAVLSGNRNFEGRINPHVRANYLASPPLVVAYALAGTMDIDLAREPLGTGKDGKPVVLKDIWPTEQEIEKALHNVKSDMFEKRYANVFEGDAEWKHIEAPSGATFTWDEKSTYVRKPPYFDNMPKEPAPLKDIQKARVLVMVGDSVTTDHISPAGSIAEDSPAGKYLQSKGVDKKDFNSYGSRRGNHEIMMRGTFANIRLRNQMAPGTEGGFTRYLGSVIPAEAGIQKSGFPVKTSGNDKSQITTIFDASMKYQKDNVPLIVLAGKEYGSGSSRDWAAKGPALLGIKAVIAESYERIHRSNLIGMGVLPLQFENGQNRESLGLTGEEEFTIEGIADNLQPGKKLNVGATPCGRPSLTGQAQGPAPTDRIQFSVLCRIDTPVELSYYQHGGILQYVLRQLLK